MIKKMLFILNFFVALFLIGCVNKTEKVKPNNPQNIEKETSEIISEATTEAVDLFDNTNFEEETHIDFNNINIFGKWRVEELALISIWGDGKTKEEYESVNGIDEEIYLGTEIEFNEKYININDEKYSFPNYCFSETDIDKFNDNVKFETTIGGIPRKIATKNLYDLIEERKYPINYYLAELNIEVKENINPPFFHCVILDNDTMITYSTKVLMLKRMK